MPAHKRIVEVEGLQNCRDLGGYHTRDGKHVVKYKHIYRSDNVGDVTPEGKKMLLEKLWLKYIIDFRGAEEKARSPYAFAGVTYFPIPIETCFITEHVLTKPSLDGPSAEALLRRISTTFLIDFKDVYKNFFDVFLREAKGQPVLFHCTAGKDRTGVAAALLLTALDVPAEAVMEDFMLTNRCCVPPSCETVRVGNCIISKDAVNILFRAQAFFLELCFGEVCKRYGSVNAYMEKELGLGVEQLEKLRSYYVRPTSSSS
ncbi:putative phosphoinositide phosphatase [Leishmania infantum JPCM5]|uniref:Phosphoinositide_phosphatase n=2 Tax=Leishmania infantum TaxID=5671 RepID=A0A6L0XNY0_LEIIN|nr:putative phosphoinositide phosphatase [Leishmania infantum JPCM5]CAC9487559.1 phosphoinositide_phosphatase [Leishmania infantum]CAM67966.1 putative phosphoinositide phosphatase [Leishmania infantum JPCM5]SUZ41714.1 phosphoinositide_phosphatase [Leishmania infantum]|eukprot:XP_001465543.1 putative phosphoinositide phosphatase [Leishmania infantum JPCM5]